MQKDSANTMSELYRLLFRAFLPFFSYRYSSLYVQSLCLSGTSEVQKCVRIILYRVPKSSNQHLREKRLTDNAVIIYTYQCEEEQKTVKDSKAEQKRKI